MVIPKSFNLITSLRLPTTQILVVIVYAYQSTGLLAENLYKRAHSAVSLSRSATAMTK